MPATYTLIASNTLSSSAASVTFSAIPGTYTDLVIRSSARSNSGGVSELFLLRFNSDTTTKYSYNYVNGTGATAGAGIFSAKTSAWALYVNGGATTANSFGNIEIYIPSYNSTANKPYSSFGANEDNNSTAYIAALAGLYTGTSGITSIDILPGNGTNFVSGSSFFLYGIKNS